MSVSLGAEQGTTIAARSGNGLLSLGYRVRVVFTANGSLVLRSGSCSLMVSTKDLSSSGFLESESPLMLLQRLTEDGGFGTIQLRVAGADWFQLIYRRDLDGATEFSPIGDLHRIETVNVTCPTDEFGWLHPASAYPFVLDGQYWRTAAPRDWPWPLARDWRSQPNSSEFRRVMKTALLAHPALRRRLLALRCAVSVAGVPAGLIEELACLLRMGRLVEDSYA